MTIRSDVLTDAANEVWLEEFRLSAQDDLRLAGSNDWHLAKRVLRAGPSANVDLVTINNGRLAVDLLPTRGMGFWRGSFQGKELGWRSPVRFPVHPGLINLSDQHGTGWLAGFNEWMCRCGLRSIGPPRVAPIGSDGSPVVEPYTTLHGRIANCSAHFVSTEVDTAGEGTLTVRGIVDEAALFGGCLRLDSSLRTTAGSSCIELSDTITNLSDTPGEAQLLYHINFGPPLLGEGSRIYAAIEQLAPYDEHSARNASEWDVCGKPIPGFVQQCYLLRPLVDQHGTAAVLLCNPTNDFGVRITFATHSLPCLTLWKNFAGEQDGYVLGLEPGTSYPNPKIVERQLGRVPCLESGESLQTSVQLTFLDDPAATTAAIEAVAKQQAAEHPQIHHHLQPGFSFPSGCSLQLPQD